MKGKSNFRMGHLEGKSDIAFSPDGKYVTKNFSLRWLYSKKSQVYLELRNRWPCTEVGFGRYQE